MLNVACVRSPIGSIAIRCASRGGVLTLG